MLDGLKELYLNLKVWELIISFVLLVLCGIAWIILKIKDLKKKWYGKRRSN